MLPNSFKLIFIVISILMIWAFWLEPDSLKITKLAINVPGWHKEHNNFKVAVISDIHFRAPYIDVPKLKKIVKMVNDQKPDLILIPGDFIESDQFAMHLLYTAKIKYISPLSEPLKDLKAPCGVFAVLGNHDWWFNGDLITTELKKANIKVLENNSIEINKNGKSFWIAGIADVESRTPNIAKTLSDVKDDNPVIAMTHNPDIFPSIPSRISLTLAGHTHGGQVRFPFVGSLIVPSIYGQRYALGLIHEKNSLLYVSSGIGTSMMAVRFCVPPQIFIINLKADNKKT